MFAAALRWHSSWSSTAGNTAGSSPDTPCTGGGDWPSQHRSPSCLEQKHTHTARHIPAGNFMCTLL